MTAVLEATGLHKRFGKLVAVEEVSLRLAQGEVLAFLGPNGAGKTTTIKMLAGLLWPDRGQVHLMGKEAQTGTLEQVFLTPYGPIPLLLVRNLAGLGTQLLLMGSIALVLLLITGARLSFTPLLLLPITTVLLGGYGLGFAMASLALLFKRVQQLLGISQFLLIFLLQYPLEGSGWLAKLGYFVPLVPGADLTRQMMAKEAALDWNLLGLALLNGLAYLALGIVVFSRAVQAAKRRGLLFGY
ncbi:ATP-binding cassette domain-containing protein [Meiothermus cerbereus]|uniref:ATP-binding cassette domain-containing protein n=1 Tax=Meiothermus cerbereus TaxID=65552 RepID=UPI003EE95FD6